MFHLWLKMLQYFAEILSNLRHGFVVPNGRNHSDVLCIVVVIVSHQHQSIDLDYYSLQVVHREISFKKDANSVVIRVPDCTRFQSLKTISLVPVLSHLRRLI